MSIFPNMILLTDDHPHVNGAGISQTLFNLFCNFPGTIWLYLDNKGIFPETSNSLKVSRLSYSSGPWKPLTNRLGKYANLVLLRRQLRWQAQQRITKNAPEPTQVYVLVSTTAPQKLHLAWCFLQQGYTVVPYFMDDWMAGDTLHWKGGNIQQVIREILQAAPCWLVISRQLEATLRKRYALEKKPCLLVHNPAPAPLLSPQRGEDRVDSSQLIIYAGSIWPMHADALIATARAIHVLQDAGCRSYKLIIYTGEAHWKKYQQQLQGPGVTYGGWKSYSEIHEALSRGWLLLCTASFNEQHKAFSDSSVQTKLTDYMAAGKPVLFVGPADAASGVFVEEHDVGFTVETSKPEDIAARLEAISRMPQVPERRASNGLQLARTIFSKPVVQQRLYDFLEQYALPSLEGWPEAGVGELK